MADGFQNSVTKSDLVKGLSALGIVPCDVLLVHSSLKSFGRIEGGAETVIDGLLETVAPGGTVMVPALTGRRQDGPSDPPTFDVRTTPCWTGIIPETFRRRADARRSLHPTHSVAAIGPAASSLISGHLDSPTPCGKGSPYLRLAERKGKVVFLGVDLACCTLLHSVEELAGCPYHMQHEPAMALITDCEGRSFRHQVLLHDWGTPRDFARIEPELREAGFLRTGKIGTATVRILDAGPLVDYALARLKENPMWLCRS